MPENDAEFAALMERIRQGSEGAARELVDRYGPDMLEAVRRKLSRKLRRCYDSVDFQQSVWKSFFASLPETGEIQQPDDLAAYLARMARNKVIDAYRRGVRARKRNANQEHSLDSALVSERQDPLIADQDTPSHEVSVKEEWERFVERKPMQYRRILELLRQGNNAEEIADILGLHPQTVRRALRRLFPREAP